MQKILEVKNITKIYKMYKSNFDRLKEIFLNRPYHREFVSNRDISFDLYEAETLGIIGVNGAGKSTILKIIAGVISPTSGEIIRHGRVTALLELGTGFNDELSGYENIFLNGTLIGMSEQECTQKAKEIIIFSELGDYIYEPIKTYSSGMKMRLAFSIAIYSEPQVLIVDEALSVGDAHFAAKCTKALKQRKEQNMSIIYVSHDLNSLKLLCDRVILLSHGEVVQEG
ncbi:MAG: ABC transporter ATP-binding protein, partial [Sulfurimonas sp.]|nr:ABC transporter ATP-binding protein [Sulfurimonas sp.]